MIKVLAKDSAYSLMERESFIKELHPAQYRHFVYLQTCDRVELYYDDSDSLSFIEEEGLIRRLFRITAGLESPLPGENQIQHQVKQAYLKSVKAHTVSKRLHLLFQKALMVGKRVRHQTAISEGAISHSLAAVEIIKDKVTDLSGAKVVIIGVNHLNESIVKYLVKNDGDTIFLANRSYDQALALAQQMNVFAFTFEELDRELLDTDVLICATSAPHIIVPLSRFPRDKEMLIIDLAVPRDVDPAIAELSRVELYTIPQIEGRIQGSIHLRREEVVKAEAIIEEELGKFLARIDRVK